MTSGISRQTAAAVDALFRSEAGELFAFTVAKLTQGNRDKADDLVQLTFQAAAMNWDELRRRDHAGRRRWLYRVIRNKAVDQWRATTRLVPIDDLAERQAPHVPGADQQALSAVALRAAWAVIQAMPPDRARVVYLRWQEEWSTNEIAAWLGIEPSTVRGHVKRARDELMIAVRPQVPFDEDPERPDQTWEGGAAL